MHLEELVADFKFSLSQVEHPLLIFCSSFIPPTRQAMRPCRCLDQSPPHVFHFDDGGVMF